MGGIRLMIKILNTQSRDFDTLFEQILLRGKQDIEGVTHKASQILQEVANHKQSAILEQVRLFDEWNPKTINDLFITPQECQKAYQALDKDQAKALHIAYERIYSFHQKQKQQTWLDIEDNGSILGQRWSPIERVGLYIPGGKAAYPSSLLMNAIPAIVAGSQSIVVCTPTPKNQTNHLLLAALHICGIKEIYKVGGASAIGLMAYGIENIKKVDFISGPGNIFVATAKKIVFGEVGIDMIAGPSEIAIIADDKANVEYLAYDLLSQAEHDEMASSFLFTTSCEKAKQVAQTIDKILPTLPKERIASQSINNRGAIIVCDTLDEAIHLSNQLAPEHLEILTERPFEVMPKIKHAGAIFLGENTPEPIGDYLAGPNHTLPTGGSARFFSPLGVENFMKRSSIISFSKQAIKSLGKDCSLLAHLENLDAHKQAVLARLDTKQ